MTTALTDAESVDPTHSDGYRQAWHAINSIMSPLVNHCFSKLRWSVDFPDNVFIPWNDMSLMEVFKCGAVPASPRIRLNGDGPGTAYVADSGVTIYWPNATIERTLSLGWDSILGQHIRSHLECRLKELAARWQYVQGLGGNIQFRDPDIRWTDTTRIITTRDGRWVGATRAEYPGHWLEGPGYAAMALVYRAARVSTFRGLHADIYV